VLKINILVMKRKVCVCGCSQHLFHLNFRAESITLRIIEASNAANKSRLALQLFGNLIKACTFHSTNRPIRNKQLIFMLVN
jgi:hypothetical protein